MGESLKASHLRHLMRTAQHLRRSADGTDDARYIGLFLSAAAAVEHRANEIANSAEDDLDADDTDIMDAAASAFKHIDMLI